MSVLFHMAIPSSSSECFPSHQHDTTITVRKHIQRCTYTVHCVVQYAWLAWCTRYLEVTAHSAKVTNIGVSAKFNIWSNDDEEEEEEDISLFW